MCVCGGGGVGVGVGVCVCVEGGGVWEPEHIVFNTFMTRERGKIS